MFSVLSAFCTRYCFSANIINPLKSAIFFSHSRRTRTVLPPHKPTHPLGNCAEIRAFHPLGKETIEKSLRKRRKAIIILTSCKDVSMVSYLIKFEHYRNRQTHQRLFTNILNSYIKIIFPPFIFNLTLPALINISISVVIVFC